MNRKTTTSHASKPARKPARRRTKVTEKAAAFDFVGKVESIVVKGGSGAESFEFGLRGRHGLRQTLRLGTADSFALSIMAPIVTAAHATETKIGVRVAPAESGVPQVIEVASRPKLGKAG